jgi:hypothetical protein
MSDESIPKSARLTPDETKFLDDMHMDFSTFTHEAIEDKKKKHRVLTKKQKINHAVINGFYICLGMLFFMTLGSQSNILVIAIVGGIGAMFSLLGGINLYLSMKEDGFFVRKQK